MPDDLLRIVELSAGGRPVQIRDVNDGSAALLGKDTLTETPPSKTPLVSAGSRRYSGSRVVGERQDNGAISFVLAAKGATENAALAEADRLVAEVSSDAQGRLVEFRPRGASQSTFYEIRGPAAVAWTINLGMLDANQAVVVEVSFPVAPLKLGLPMDIGDPFDVDSLADYTFDAGGGTVSVSGGQLVPSTTAEKRFYHSARGYRYEDCQVTIKHTTPSSLGATYEIGAILKRLDANNYLWARLAESGAGRDIVLYKRDGGGDTLLATLTAPTALSTSTSYWFRVRTEGNKIVVERFTSEPGLMSTPATGGGTYTLTGANATKFGVGVSGDGGVRWNPFHTSARLDDVKIEPFTYRDQTLPKVIQLGGEIPGSAPALCDLHYSEDGGQAVWAMIAWNRRGGSPISGAVTPFGILAAEDATLQSGTFATVSDAAYDGGSGRRVTTSGAASVLLRWDLDLSVIDPDEFSDDVALELWGRFEIASTVVSPRARVFANRMVGDNQVGRDVNSEWGDSYRPLVPPSTSGQKFRNSRLGVLSADAGASASRKLRLWLAMNWAAGSSGAFGLDELYVVAARRRSCGPTGLESNSSYPDFLVGSFFATDASWTRIVRSDGSGKVAIPGANLADYGGGMGPLWLPPGLADVFVKVAAPGPVPDDPVPSADTEAAPTVQAGIHLAVQPRYQLGRGS